MRGFAVAIATAAVHVAMIGLACEGGGPSRHEPPRTQRVAIRLASPPPQRIAVASPRVSPAARAPAPGPAAPVTPPAPHPVEAKREIVAQPSPAASEPVSGAVFGMPRFGFGVPGTAPARWMNPPSTAVSMTPAPNLALLAQAAQNAERARMAETLRRREDDDPVSD